MAVLISHASALVLWLANPDTLRQIAQPVQLEEDARLSCSAASLAMARKALDNLGLIHEATLDLLIDQRTRCHHLRDARVHYLAAVRSLSRGAVLRIGDGLYVSSPALAICQAAPLLDDWELVSLISTMMGTYTTCEYASFGIIQRRPLVTTRNLEALTRQRPRELRERRIHRATSLAFANCRSPAEVKLAMLLMLPCRHGGSGLPAGAINEHVRLDETAHAMCGQWDAYYDLGWKESGYVLEYIGSEAHQDRAKDARRSAALRHMGYDVTEITQEQLESQKFMDALAGEIADELHLRARPIGKNAPQQRKELMQVIRGAGDPWCRKLFGRSALVTEDMRPGAGD